MSTGDGERLGTLTDVLEDYFPLSWAEDWDRVGLVAGDPEWRIHRIRLAVDPTLAEARIAAESPGTLLITHHPLLLRGASFVATTSGKGRILTDLIGARSALWCGHTNTDRSLEGTVGAWIRALGLEDARPLVGPAERGEDSETPFGLGAVGTLPAPVSVEPLARQVAQVAPSTAQGVLYTGDAEREVRRVALCPGAGDSFLDAATAAGADAYITSDLRHHPALEHLESAADPARVPALIDLPHYASEFLYLPHVAGLLRERFPHLEIEVSDRSSDPFTGAVR